MYAYESIVNLAINHIYLSTTRTDGRTDKQTDRLTLYTHYNIDGHTL